MKHYAEGRVWSEIEQAWVFDRPDVSESTLTVGSLSYRNLAERVAEYIDMTNCSCKPKYTCWVCDFRSALENINK